MTHQLDSAGFTPLPRIESAKSIHMSDAGKCLGSHESGWVPAERQAKKRCVRWTAVRSCTMADLGAITCEASPIRPLSRKHEESSAQNVGPIE